MVKPYLSVIIPAYNEAERITNTLFDIDKYLSQAGYSSEIIVVNDASKDNTSIVVNKLCSVIKNLRLIDNEENKGKGGVVAQGMLNAKGSIRLFMDADNSTDIRHFERMRPYFLQGYQVVIGSLSVAGASIMRGGGEPFWRVLLGKLGNLWIQIWAVPGMWDTQRGFKAFTDRAAEDIFRSVTIAGWGFDIEALAIARARGYRIREVPVTWNNDRESRVTIWSYPRTLWDAVLVGLRRIRGTYNS